MGAIVDANLFIKNFTFIIDIIDLLVTSAGQGRQNLTQKCPLHYKLFIFTASSSDSLETYIR